VLTGRAKDKVLVEAQQEVIDMASNLLYTSTSNLGALLGNGKVYRVPNFQRDYSWKEDEWEDLWNDILGLDGEQVHYMGYIVLQSDDMQNFIIIDGQQPLTTLSVMALAVLKHLQDLIEKGIEPDQNKERIDILRNDFLGHKDPSSLIPTSKLFLNRNNDDFYQSFLLRLRKPSNVQRLKPSEKLLWKSYVYFYDTLKEHFGDRVSGQDLARFLNESVSKRLVFTVIQVVADNSFKNDFSTKSVNTSSGRGKKLARYILFSIENHLSNKDYDYEDGTATVEHILPENPSEQWEQFFSPEEEDASVYRLGNLTLLEVSKNKLCGNASYEDKLKIYQTSAYRLTSQETNFAEWTPETLHKRQERMAKWVNAVWRIDY
jgi:hypothetical protein